jgi:hypothetical protein
MGNDRAELPAPLAPHFPEPRYAPSLGRSMPTDWDNTDKGFRGLAHSVRPNLFSQWNGNIIYRSARGLISKRTTRVGGERSRGGWLTQPYQTNPPAASCAPSSSHAYHRRCPKIHSRCREAVESRPRRSHGIDQKPLECAAALAIEKGVRLHILFWSQRQPSLIKSDRSVRDADLAQLFKR